MFNVHFHRSCRSIVLSEEIHIKMFIFNPGVIDLCLFIQVSWYHIKCLLSCSKSSMRKLINESHCDHVLLTYLFFTLFSYSIINVHFLWAKLLPMVFWKYEIYNYPSRQVLAIESIDNFIGIIWNEISQWIIIHNKTAYYFVFYTKNQNMLSISKVVEQYCLK